MSYSGYIDTICSFLENFHGPAVLEIGVDKGSSLFPIVNYLTMVTSSPDYLPQKFYFVGIDVLLRESVKITASLINKSIFTAEDPTDNRVKNKNIGFVELRENLSTKAMSDFLQEGWANRFHVIMIDGDHNYQTVSQELELAKKLIHPSGFIICDDYGGKGGEQDEFFSETTGFYGQEEINENIKNLLKREDVLDHTKKGVKLAVDEFLEQSEGWKKTITPYEPVILSRDNIRFDFSYKDMYPSVKK